MSGKRKEFPNNWQKFKDAPDDLFHQHTFDEIMDWRVGAWELPSNISCLIRKLILKQRRSLNMCINDPGASRTRFVNLCRKTESSSLFVHLKLSILFVNQTSKTMNLGMNFQNFDRLTQQLMDEIESIHTKTR